MKAINPNVKFTLQATIDALQAHMKSKSEDSFEEIRAKVVPLAGADDGTVHQACLDAGYEVVVESAIAPVEPEPEEIP